MSLLRTSVAVAPLLSAPEQDAICVSESLYGEHVTLLEKCGSWIRAKQHHDQYEGFIHSSQLNSIDELDTAVNKNTHWVVNRSTLLFEKPDLKSRVMHRIPFASELQLADPNTTAFTQTHCGHYVWSDHCQSIDNAHSMQPLELARAFFLGMPYRWGGRSPEGADCSGLIQLLARSQRIFIPRDSGDQEQAIKTIVPDSDIRKMDIVYWPGHTGIMIDTKILLHSTAHSLSCVTEPLQAVVDRAGIPSSIRRLFS